VFRSYRKTELPRAQRNRITERQSRNRITARQSRSRFSATRHLDNPSPSFMFQPMDQLHNRGMPRWREKQRTLSPALKLQMIGQFIQETRQLELFKKSCKPSVIPLSNSFKKES
jgi:hypothetical protein